MSSEDRRPDWDYWKNVPNWTILEAVTLSMDRDTEDKQSNLAEFLGSTKFKKRLSLAMRNLDDKGKLTVTWTVPGDRAKWEVTHASFAAQAVRWWKSDVPHELAALAEATENPLTTKESHTLLIIIAGLCREFRFDPEDRGAASRIAKMTEGIGAAVTADTIRKWLQKIPDLLQSRKK